MLTGNEKHLNLRAFTNSQKYTLYEGQKGICNQCEESFNTDQMEADHITPWSEGGKTELENGQVLCRECNRRKSNH
ncbi:MULTISPECIES: HNH endonuclease [unclassified Endozoicomonas]|uniref:HNH endonuclease n=1 Tax=unclassified Endozoicomonas TaxID=2644528 RepID=UPI002147AFB7|nr:MULTISPECIES: HNH endonuclease signature motif containing protein [unclassified Endozoicomonas]